MISFSQFLSDLSNPALAFLPNALLVSVLSAVVCGVVGAHVVLRGMAFIGDAVAHAVFPGIVIAFALQGSVLLGGAVAGAIVAVLIALFSQKKEVKEDAAIGIFFAAAFALGLVIISGVQGNTASLTSFLFGSITGVSDEDIVMVAVCGVVVLGVLAVFNRHIVAVSLDRETAAAQGVRVLLMDLVLYLAVTAAVVISVRTVGNILVLALLVTPAATARLWTSRLRVMMLLSAVIGALGSFAGVYISWAVDIPTGATIVLVLTVVFFVSMLCQSSAVRKGIGVMRNRDKAASAKGGHAVAAAVLVAALVGGWTAVDSGVAPSAQAAQQGNRAGATAVRDAGDGGDGADASNGTDGGNGAASDSDAQAARFVIPVTGKKVAVDPAIDGFAQKAYRLDVTSAWAKVPEGGDQADGTQPAEGQRLRISEFSGPKNARMLLVDGEDVLLDSRDLDQSTVRLGSDYLFDTDGDYLVTFVVDDPTGASDSDQGAREVHVRFAVGQAATAATPAKGSQITGIVAALKNIESQLKRLAVVIPAMVDAWRGLLKLPAGAGGSSAANSGTKPTGAAQATGQATGKPTGNGKASGQNLPAGQGEEYLINVDKNSTSGTHAGASGNAGAASATNGDGASDDAQAAAKALGYSHTGGASTANASGSGTSTSGKLPIAPGYSDPAASASNSGGSSNSDSGAQGVHKLDSPGKDHSTPADNDGSDRTVSNSPHSASGAGSDDEKTGIAALASKMADGGFAAGLLAGIGLMALLGGLLFFVLALRNYRKAKASAHSRG